MRILLLGLCIGLAGCARVPSGAPEAAPIPVTVSRPVERDVTDYADFTSRTAAVDSVEVRSHVWGYLDKVNFKEGDLVKTGDVLFEIDPRPYKAQVDQDKADLVNKQATVVQKEALFRRTEALVGTRAASRDDYDVQKGDYEVARAAVGQAEARLWASQLNLDWTKVTAPVSGRVSRYVVTVGNMIQSGDQNGGTLLTTIVSVDPMYAYYDVDEHTAL